MWSDNPYKYKGIITRIKNQIYIFILNNKTFTDGIPITTNEYDKLTEYDVFLVEASFYDGTQPVILEPLLEKYNFEDIFIKIHDVHSFHFDSNKRPDLIVENIIVEDTKEFYNLIFDMFKKIKNNL